MVWSWHDHHLHDVWKQATKSKVSFGMVFMKPCNLPFCVICAATELGYDCEHSTQKIKCV